MGTEQIIGLILALLLMCVGLAGSVLPALPGPPLVLIAAVAHRLYFGEQSVGNVVLAMLVLLTLFSFALDYLATLFGARQMGATWRGVVGGGVGLVVGLFLGPFGVLIGPFAGATLLELASGREFQEAARAGTGAVLGMLAGAVGKVACCLAMIGLFTVNVAWRS